MSEPTYAEKIQTWAGGDTKWDAQFPAPPVHTTMWNNADWIRWVDQKGFWFRKVKEENTNDYS